MDTNTLVENVSKREKVEHLASATLTTATLSNLKITIEGLPQKSQQLLRQAANYGQGMEELDPIALGLRHSKKMSQSLQDDYEILKLKQKNQVLQTQIDKNKKVIDGLRRDLLEAEGSLSSRNPNPENIDDHLRQLQQKIATYDENCKKATTFFSKLSVPEGIYPKSLDVLISQLVTLKSEEMTLKEEADEVIFEREMRSKLRKL